jgi:hypothetical protein
MKRYIWVIESREKKVNDEWGRWIAGEAFTNRQDAVFAGNPYKDECGETRITKYVSTRK